ncbi:hypothetical protein [Staphylococcus hominis]|nr:hypothetical protein [Staphylococcus hominis]WRY64875.1 hypothetical protein P8632_07095 [Staphylococcus hominis]
MTLIDLMTDKEIEIWNKLNAAERVGIILSFNLMLFLALNLKKR